MIKQDSNPVSRNRNIGIIAHVDAGKTTLTERLLFFSGMSHKMGDVDSGNTITDFTEEERKRGITIGSAAVTVRWKDHNITIIDTPGHIDFNIEVKRALRVLDGAVVVFDAVAGVEPQSETNWRLADQYSVPRIALINKMDRIGADFHKTVQEIEKRLGSEALVLQLPVGIESDFHGVIDLISMQYHFWPTDENLSEQERQEGVLLAIPDNLLDEARQYREQLLDKISLVNDRVLENLVEGREVSKQLIIEAVRQATIQENQVPVLCGSAYKRVAVHPVLDALCNYLPAPEDLVKVGAENSKQGNNLEVPRSKDNDFLALAFKKVADHHGTLTFIRVYSGQLQAGEKARNGRTDKQERLGRIFRVEADKRVPVEAISAGDIVAVLGLKDVQTGDTLTTSKMPIVLESIAVPAPVIEMTIESRSPKQQEHLLDALKQMTDEDPSLHLTVSETGETLLSGMGELHLEVALSRLSNDFDVDVRVGQPRVSYRETLTAPVETGFTFIRQRGGAGQFAEVSMRFEPLEPGQYEKIDFENRVTGNNLSKEYIPAVESGIRMAAKSGVLQGYVCGGFKAILLDGSEHPQDSSTIAFEIAGTEIFRKAAAMAEPKLMEPVMSLEIVTPQEYVGDCIGDISRRKGLVKQQQQRGNSVVIHAEAPLSSMFGYIGDLRSFTSGRGSYSMEFSHYDLVH